MGNHNTINVKDILRKGGQVDFPEITHPLRILWAAKVIAFIGEADLPLKEQRQILALALTWLKKGPTFAEKGRAKTPKKGG